MRWSTSRRTAHAELRALAQHRLHRGEEVLGFVGQLEVGVARDAERVVREDLHPREQRVEMRGDDLLERDEPLRPGSATKRGSSGGTFTRANRCSPVAGWRTATARLSERFEMYGKGCAGSTASGVSTGKMRSSNSRVSSARSSSPSSSQSANSTPASCKRRRDLLGEHARLATDELFDPVADRAELFDLVEAVGRRCCARRPRAAPCRPETRTWKNSSRFELKIARNFARSSSGSAGVLREREHARVEVEPRQLAVEVARVLDGGISDDFRERHGPMVMASGLRPPAVTNHGG